MKMCHLPSNVHTQSGGTSYKEAGAFLNMRIFSESESVKFIMGDNEKKTKNIDLQAYLAPMAILNFACCGILVFFITMKNGMDISSAFLLPA